MSVRYGPNPFFEEEVRTQPRFQEGLRGIAKAVSRYVIAAAPHRSGYYKRHVKAVGAGVEADDSFWHWIEFGSVHNVPRAPLRRGFRAGGLRLVVHPKP